ncbi:hypothetical protein M3Y97_00451900 [Aphelenchoides bicaudatus]|nr:hypothetical protein M3Y97_00451900 [Aphelenchoides bicaudatus]
MAALRPEPSSTATSWTSMRFSSNSTGTSNVDYTKARLLATATAQTSGRPLASPTKFSASSASPSPNKINKVEDRHIFSNLRARFGDAVSRTTAPILSFTNKVSSNKVAAASKNDSNREDNQRFQPSRQVIKGSVTRFQTKSEPRNTQAMDEYTKGFKLF